MNASCSMFSQILKLIPGTDFKRIVTEKGGNEHLLARLRASFLASDRTYGARRDLPDY